MRIVALLAVIVAAAWIATQPRPLADDTFAGITGDATRGQQVFTMAGCASCHQAKDGTLSGGTEFPSDFGTFVAPNISADPEHGIGGWSLPDFANAVMRGISPDGRHYYPAFPYTAYSKAEPRDIADLKAYMDTLPASATPSQPHRVGFPFNIRRGLGVWKLLYLRPEEWVSRDDTKGRYIVEAMAHCGECHTPRGPLGGLDTTRWLQGAEKIAPDIAGLDWSEGEILEYLTSGFTPDYDSAGGHMALVVENLAELPQTDREAVVAYLKNLH